MFDHFSLSSLENALSTLEPSQSDTLIDDPIFKLFRTVLDEPCSGLQELWQDMFNKQEYCNIVEYIAPIPNLTQHIHNNEPGTFLDYKMMRENLHEVQDYIQGGQQVILDMYSFLNHLTGTHVDFVLSTVSMSTWQLFSKMVDIFYGLVRDFPFEHFVMDTIDTHTIDWPPYEIVKSSIASSICKAQTDVCKAAQGLLRLKSSPDLVTFTSYLAGAASYRNKITNNNSQFDLGADTQDELENILQGNEQAEEEDQAAINILQRYTGPLTSASILSRRKAAVTRRNILTAQARITKNHHHRETNKSNTHQYGNMTRLPISATIIRALSMIQETYRISLTEEDEKEQQEGIVGGLKGMTIEALEEEFNEREPMGGMILGKGFEVLNSFGEVV